MSIGKNCHVIAVTGGKGGVGKSLLTANMALAMQKEFKAPTLLLDLDGKSCGDQNVILGLRSKSNVQQFCGHKGAFNQQALNTLLARHPQGLSFLSAVLSSEQRLAADPALFKKQFLNLSQFFNYIFVDIGCDLSPLQETVLDSASAVLLVVTPEILAVNQTRRILSDLSHLPGALMHLIVNKANGSGLNSTVIQNTMRRPILISLPEDSSAVASLHASRPLVTGNPQSPLAKGSHDIVRKLTSGILQRGKELGRSPAPKKASSSASAPKSDLPARGESKMDSVTLLKLQIHSELIKEMDLKKDLTKAVDEASRTELKNKARTVISRLVDLRGRDLSREQRAGVIQHVLDEALGLGVLEELLKDTKIGEIMVNGCDQVYYEKEGKLRLSQHTITSNVHLKNIIERIVTPLGRRIDEKTPYVDARLADGSRVNAIIEPLAMDGPALTIRKFPAHRITIDDYVYRFHSITKEMADFMEICVNQGLNVVISGGTGSGKTTLLNVLSGFIPATERIITVEDAAELQLKQEHVVRLETRPANIEGEGEVSIRDLIRNTLRMRPDRIVVGECRDGAALDMLSAMNTGHDGSLTTVHANNPREAVARLETLCLMAGMELPAKAIREQIAGAVDLIIQISRLNDGSRKVKNIAEVVGMQGDVVTIQEIFRFKEEGFTKDGKITGQFQALGIIPSFIEKFEQRGIKIPRDLFTTKSSSDMKSPNKISVKAPLKIPSKASTGKAGPASVSPGGLNKNKPGRMPSLSSSGNPPEKKAFKKIIKRGAV